MKFTCTNVLRETTKREREREREREYIISLKNNDDIRPQWLSKLLEFANRARTHALVYVIGYQSTKYTVRLRAPNCKSSFSKLKAYRFRVRVEANYNDDIV